MRLMVRTIPVSAVSFYACSGEGENSRLKVGDFASPLLGAYILATTQPDVTKVSDELIEHPSAGDTEPCC